MQRLCALAGVIAVVTFSSGVNAALIRMDDSRTGKEPPTNTRAARQAAPVLTGANAALAGEAIYGDVRFLAAKPSFIDMAGGVARQETVSFDSGDDAGRRAADSHRNGAPHPLLNAATDDAAGTGLGRAVTSGWAGGGDWLLGRALAGAPEASTTGLLLTGLGLLWLLRRRNSRLQETAADAVADDAAAMEGGGAGAMPPSSDTVVTLSGETGRLRLPGGPTPPQLGQLRRQSESPSISIRRMC